jgi:hypothetical protein
MADAKAEQAIRNAIGDLIRDDAPRNATTVPPAAIERLSGGKVPTDAPERIYGAIGAMAARGNLIAPAEPWKDWLLA